MILVGAWDMGTTTREALGAAREFGEEVTVVNLSADHFGEAAISALAELTRAHRARLVLLARDHRTAEIAPRLSERLGGTSVSQVVAVNGEIWTCAAFGGKALISVKTLCEPVVATLMRRAFSEADIGSAQVVDAPAAAQDDAIELLAHAQPSLGGVALEDAKVIVSGGAGLGDQGGFDELEELAALLGGSAGASLAPVDAGWAPAERKIGLTGKRVHPDVYFAFGISGASQHLTGIAGAKTVVAVNTDPDAPIFKRARVGVVMDCRVLVRALIYHLRNASPPLANANEPGPTTGIFDPTSGEFVVVERIWKGRPEVEPRKTGRASDGV